jgi:hypothetical protein
VFFLWGTVMGEEGFWDEDGKCDVIECFTECVVREGEEVSFPVDVLLVLSVSDFHAEF